VYAPPSPRAGLLAAAFAAAALVAPSAAHASSVFGGTTKQHEPIVLKADARAQTLRSVVVGLEADCPDGDSYPVWGTFNVTRAAAGFSTDEVLATERNARGRFTGKILREETLQDGSGNVTMTMSGRMSRHSARGTLGGTVAIVDAGGKTVETCTAPETSWAATSRPGVVFGGATAQDEPVVMRLDDSRRKVADFLFSWHAPCQPTGGLRVPDGLTNFAITGGSFGGKPHDQFPADGGGQLSLDYGLTGMIRHRVAAGTLSAQTTNNDATGAQRAQCSTGDVSWQVASS
jgi:hypothetical protein